MGNKSSGKTPLNILKIPIYAVSNYYPHFSRSEPIGTLCSWEAGAGTRSRTRYTCTTWRILVRTSSQRLCMRSPLRQRSRTSSNWPAGERTWSPWASRKAQPSTKSIQNRGSSLKIQLLSKLAKLQEFDADFKKEEPCVNCCRFSRDNQLLATGGDDFSVRLFELDTKDFASARQILELSGHYDSVNAVDISPDKKMLVSSSADRSCIIYNLERNGQKIKKLTFNHGQTDNAKNMIMRGCFFDPRGQFVYTLATEMRQRSFFIKWETKDPFKPLDVEVVHSNTAKGMLLSGCGKLVGLMNSDGFVKVFELEGMKEKYSAKRHKMPVTCMSFRHDIDGEADYVLTGSPDYTYNIIAIPSSWLGSFVGFLWSLVWPVLLILLILDFAYN